MAVPDAGRPRLHLRRRPEQLSAHGHGGSSAAQRLGAAVPVSQYVDCTAGLPGTIHDYGRLPPEKRVRIDYIFSDGRCLDAYVVPDQPVNGQYYSDHNAVVALIELP